MRNMTLRKAKQKGFTLLELLVVITILAILATGALLAYDGLTDTAQASANSNNIATADQSIRNYRAVTGNFPNQWDHLVTDSGDGATGGVGLDFVANETYRFLAQVDAAALSRQIQNAFNRVGVDEFQVRTTSGLTAGVEPNLQHNEGAVQVAGAAGTTLELETFDNGAPNNFFNRLVVVPAARATTVTAGVPTAAALCAVGATGAVPTVIRATDTAANVLTPLTALNFLNRVNDAFEGGQCNLVAAFGFGGDAAKSTTGSPAAIVNAPTYVSNVIKPNVNYARYIALFHLGRDSDRDGVIETNEVFSKPVLVGIIDPQGNQVDQSIATANTVQQQ